MSDFGLCARPSASLLWNVVATLIRLKDCVTLRFLGPCFPPIQFDRPVELSKEGTLVSTRYVEVLLPQRSGMRFFIAPE